jgi:hypothetical protein
MIYEFKISKKSYDMLHIENDSSEKIEVDTDPVQVKANEVSRKQHIKFDEE